MLHGLIKTFVDVYLTNYCFVIENNYVELNMTKAADTLIAWPGARVNNFE